MNLWSQTSYAPSISRRDNTRSIKGRMPGSLEMAMGRSGKAATWKVYLHPFDIQDANFDFKK